MDYAVKVEAYTLGKAANLVLNVDGCIGALFLDLLTSSSQFSQVEHLCSYQTDTKARIWVATWPCEYLETSCHELKS